MRRLSLGQPLGATVDAKVNWLVDAVKRIELASNEDFAEVTPIKAITGLTDVKNVQAALEGLQTGKEPTNALLTAIAALSMVADRYIYGDGTDSVDLGTITAAGRAILDDADAAAQRTTLNVPIDGYLYGLTLSNNSTDATNDIDIATGVATDSTNAVLLRLSSGLTKRLDASWSVGTGNGGLDTGSIANTTYYVWLIKRSDTGVVDALFSTSATSPTMPTNYDYKRRIGCIIRSAGAILAFAQQGDHFLLQNAISEYATANPGTSVVTVTMTGIPAAVPRGELEALFNFTLYDGSPAAATYCLINNAQVTTTVPSSTNNNLQLPSASGGVQVASVLVRMPPSGQGIRFRLSNSDAGIIVRLLTYGWVDYRGKPG